MPFLKRSPTSQPRSKLLDAMSQKCGLRSTVFSGNGDEYKGDWQNNKKHGKGTQISKSGTMYIGEWAFGKPDGYGTLSVLVPETKQYATKYCGGWKNGKKHGFGMHFYEGSAVYEGEWREDHRSGCGKMWYKNGDLYEGGWMKDKSHGQGTILFANGNRFEGTWQDGKKNGNGKFYYSDKGQVYEGLWLDGMAKCGTMSDFGRNEAPAPTQHPIPQLQLVDMQLVLSEAKSAYIERINSKFPPHYTGKE